MRCNAPPRCPGDSWPVPGWHFYSHAQPRGNLPCSSSAPDAGIAMQRAALPGERGALPRNYKPKCISHYAITSRRSAPAPATAYAPVAGSGCSGTLLREHRLRHSLLLQLEHFCAIWSKQKSPKSIPEKVDQMDTVVVHLMQGDVKPISFFPLPRLPQPGVYCMQFRPTIPAPRPTPPANQLLPKIVGCRQLSVDCRQLGDDSHTRHRLPATPLRRHAPHSAPHPRHATLPQHINFYQKYAAVDCGHLATPHPHPYRIRNRHAQEPAGCKKLKERTRRSFN